VPTGPEVGEKFKMLGRIRKVVAESAGARMAPAGGKIVILAVETLAGTVTRMVLLFEIVKSVAFTLPKVIPEMAVKLVPARTTFVFERPFVGEKLTSFACAKKFVAEEIWLLLVLKLWLAPKLDVITRGPLMTPAGVMRAVSTSTRRCRQRVVHCSAGQLKRSPTERPSGG